LVVALSRQGDEAAAIEACDKITDATLAGLDAELRGSVLYERAWCLRELDKKAEAVEAYQTLLKSSPFGPLTAPATLELAELQAGAGQCDQAIALLGPLVELLNAQSAADTSSPSIAERALYRLAVCHYELKQFERAAAVSSQFISVCGQSQLLASAHLMAGESLFSLGRHAKAATHFRAIVDESESNPARASCLLRLGECLAANNDWSGSEAAFARHLTEFADSELWFQAQFGLAWAMENQSHHEKAISSYRMVTDKHSGPTAARAQFQIGECYFAQKRHEDAVRELLKVDILYAYPEWSAAALYEAGRCFEAMSKPDEARAQFAQVQSEYGDSQWAKLAAERLAAISPSKSASDGRAGS
jgi:TolA-binding protein